MRAGWLVLFAALAAPAAAHNLAPELTGIWSGEAEVAVYWCDQKTLPVQVTILPDGRLNGKIGDADVIGGVVNPRRGHGPGLYRTPAEYQVRLYLSGPIVAAEGITRAWAELRVNLRDGKLTGVLETAGSHGYPGASLKAKKEKYILRATGLTLARVPEIT